MLSNHIQARLDRLDTSAVNQRDKTKQTLLKYLGSLVFTFTHIKIPSTYVIVFCV